MSTNVIDGTGKFPKGKSPNPSGRPPGSPNKKTAFLQSLLDGEGEKLIRKAIEMGLGGDIAALRLCVNRLLPVRKDRTIQVDLPPLENVQDISLAIGKVSTAIAQGEITPAEGESFTNSLKTQAEVIVGMDFEHWFEDLEDRMKPGPAKAA